KGTIHWVSAAHAVDAEVRLYERLFAAENPSDERRFASYLDALNPDSLRVASATLEPSLAGAAPGTRVQFVRLGYFVVDTKDGAPGAPVFNRTITLKDSWAKIAQRG